MHRAQANGVQHYQVEISEYSNDRLIPFIPAANDNIQLEFSMLSPFHRLNLSPYHRPPTPPFLVLLSRPPISTVSSTFASTIADLLSQTSTRRGRSQSGTLPTMSGQGVGRSAVPGSGLVVFGSPLLGGWHLWLSGCTAHPL